MSFRRISIIAAVALLFGALAVTTGRAQNTVGDFTLKSAANADVALSSYAKSKAVVVVFVNPSCAFSKLYQNRLNDLKSKYSGRGVEFLFINAPINLEASFDPDAEKLKVKTTGTELEYFTDEGQKAKAALGATKTPEAFLLTPAGNGFTVRYRGAIDDNAQVESYVKEQYLAQALDNVLAGKSVGTASKMVSGCRIKDL
ncbi:redoxin domain-containing protein [Hymenobacter persicinus]|uniref:Redoxin domain-containing protein n=1 Tax=Hymenobacter persicinus TaxID=2025506 RepID=A0A4Q5LBQ3_9BACT|nr:redoxin domain-containing protein [Hymenobacter persicinus]RYU79755.1 redoxin domain-containing protein [Hymenobacter persicinus]